MAWGKRKCGGGGYIYICICIMRMYAKRKKEKRKKALTWTAVFCIKLGSRGRSPTARGWWVGDDDNDDVLLEKENVLFLEQREGLFVINGEIRKSEKEKEKENKAT